MKQMKRALILGMTLILLLLGGATGVAIWLTANDSAVTLTEEVLYGDRRAADGLTVHIETVGHGHLLWKTDHIFGEHPVTESVLSYETDPTVLPTTAPEKGALITDNWDFVLSGYDDPHLTRLWREMEEEAKASPSHTATRELSLIDYARYIPYDIHIDRFEHTVHAKDPTYEKSFAHLADTLRTRLAIPVEPNWTVTATLTVYDYDSPYYPYSITYAGDMPHIDSTICFTEEALYLSLASKEVSGGIAIEHPALGLYRIPLDPDKTNAEAVLVEEMEKIYTPVEGERIEEICPDEYAGTLLLVTHDGTNYNLRELDGESFVPIQPLTLGQAMPDSNGASAHCLTLGNGYAIFRRRGQLLTYLVRTGEGFTVSLCTTVDEHAGTPMTDFFTAEDTDMWYLSDGARLAILSQSPRAGCGFAIAVFQGDTLEYHALYRSDLDSRLIGGRVCRVRAS